jgi:hypothetical protein
MFIVRITNMAITQNFKIIYGKLHTVTIITTYSYAREIDHQGYYFVVLTCFAVKHLKESEWKYCNKKNIFITNLCNFKICTLLID